MLFVLENKMNKKLIGLALGTALAFSSLDLAVGQQASARQEPNVNVVESKEPRSVLKDSLYALGTITGVLLILGVGGAAIDAEERKYLQGGQDIQRKRFKWDIRDRFSEDNQEGYFGDN
jgi:hypothetical protein